MTEDSKLVDAVILAGSNIDKEVCLPEAIRRLRRTSGITVRDVSTCYESESVGGPADAPVFHNAAALISTSLDPEELRTALHGIENELGRVRTDDPNAPRTADLDIIYFGDLVKHFDGWSVPDPDAEKMAHVAVPVAEVAPRWVPPVSGLTTVEIAASIV